MAFRRAARESNLIYSFDRTPIILLSGKNSKDFSVIAKLDQWGFELRYTSLERTLVDLTVRPAYAGGAAAVASAFEKAVGRVSADSLLEVLHELDHVYPYNQAIGFYLERAGASPEKLAPLRDGHMEFDFYLCHGIEQARYVKQWRLHVPLELV